MLSRISAVTAFLAACLNAAVLLGWDLTADQVAALNAVILAGGAVIHAWINPNVNINTITRSK